MNRLVLFDIDGTLMLSGGAGGRAMWHAASEILGVDEDGGSISMAGRTDSWIVAQMAARSGVPYSDEVLARFRDCYIGHLQREIVRPAAKKGLLPGVLAVLEVLRTRSKEAVGLLTGNFERGAEIKLRHFDIWDHFAFGAFGDAAHDRNRLLDVALQRHAAVTGSRAHAADVVIVGDTPLDIAVATAGGARAIGVATGDYDVETLRASGADVVLKDLSDVTAVLEALGRGTGPD